MRTIRLAICFLALTWWASPASAFVLIPESSFEGANPGADGWNYTFSWCTGSPCSLLDVSSDVAHSGSKSLKLTYNKAWSDPNEQTNTVGIFKGFGGQSDVYIRYWYLTMGFHYATPGTKNIYWKGSPGYPNFVSIHWNGSRQLGFAGQGEADCAACNYYTNMNANVANLADNVWYCIEEHVKLNTPGSSPGDGAIEVWINGTQTLSYQGQIFRGPSGSTASQLLNTMEIYKQNGGGSLTKGQAGYAPAGPAGEYGLMYYDQFKAGTTRADVSCGGGGGTPPPPPPPSDTTPPSPPTAVAATAQTATVTLSWMNGNDNTGVIGAQIRRCTGASCSPTTGQPTVSAANLTAGSFVDGTTVASTTYGYSVANIDGSGNVSSYTSPVYVTTATVFRTVLATDDFNRANGLLGANWDDGYSSYQALNLTSSQLRPTNLNADAGETYNGVSTPNDQFGQFTLSQVGGSGSRAPRVLVRFANPPTVSGYECGPASLPNTTRCGEWNAGVFTQKSSVTTWTWAAGDKLRVEAEGTTISAYGIRGTTTTLITSFTDATFASGKTGILHYQQTGTLGDVQVDDFQMGSISGTPVVPPSIASLTLDLTGATLTVGATIPSFIRLANDRTSVTVPIGDFVLTAGSYRYTWIVPINGLTFECAYAQDATGVENTISNAYQCRSFSGIAPALDTDPPVLSNAQPTITLPAGTTSREYSFDISKTATCRSHATDVDFYSMTTDLASTALRASGTATGLTNGSTTTLYGRCVYTDLDGVGHANTSSIVITLLVEAAAGGDTTVPSTVANLVCTTLGSGSASCLWTAATDNVVVSSYRVLLARGDCSTYAIADTPTSASTTLFNLIASTAYCAVVLAVDSSGNLSAADSNVATFTTTAIPDVDPPSTMQNLRISRPFTESIELVCDTPTDNSGQVFSTFEQCQGSGCTDFVTIGTQVPDIKLSVQLTPGTLYRFRGIHSDLTGNYSVAYSSIVETMTQTIGLPQPRISLLFEQTRESAPRSVAGTRLPRP